MASRLLTPLKAEFLHNRKDEAVLLEPHVWNDPVHGRIVAPAGFVTDWNSTPGYVVLPGIVPRCGRGRDASVFHDLGYRGKCDPKLKHLTRKDWDDVFFRINMEKVKDPETGDEYRRLPAWRSAAAYSGVRVGGWIPWAKTHR